MPNRETRSVYFDLRCLQDGNYQYRGVGYHVASLLRTRPQSPNSKFEVIGLTDPAFPPLPAEYAALVDRVSHCWNPSLSPKGSVFVSSSPMTHDPTLSLRFLDHPNVTTAAVIYDFIPMDRDGYLPSVSSKLDYFAKVAHLKHFDRFMSISEYSAKRLHEIIGAPSTAVRVTGASVRDALYVAAARQQRSSRRNSPDKTRYFLTVGGGDRRKNTETAVRAVWLLRTLVHEPITLKVVGHYPPDYEEDLFRIATDGGSKNFVEMCKGVSDDELVHLYAGAVATIAPSFIEGFSLPVVEAAVCGSPVVASMCAAHLELIDNPDALFPATSADTLSRQLRSLLENPEFRGTLVRQQRALKEQFHEAAVGDRFWDFLNCGMQARSTAVLRRAKPRVAFLTPYPPDQSGVARFSELTLREAGKCLDVDLYTDAERPVEVPHGVRDAGNVHPALLRRGPYDSIVSVIGNSHFHLGMFEVVERFGGPCILHDSRLTHIYYRRLGPHGFAAWAGRLLKRSVTQEEIGTWLHDQDVPSLFIENILERAGPLIVHTRRFQQIINRMYGQEVAVTTFPPNLSFSDDDLTRNSRAAARQRVGIPDNVFAVATFGYVAGSKGMPSLVIAVEILRSWGIPVELFLVGSDAYEQGQVQKIAADYGVSQYIHTNTDFVSLRRYRDYMLGVDAGVQLRTYDFGQPSAALADCISACLPTVANDSLADSCDGPSYVTRIQNHISPLLLAERLASMHECRPSDAQMLSERHSYLEEHNFTIYTQRLIEALGLA